MSNRPTFFSPARLTQLFLYFCGALGLVVLFGWVGSHYTGLKIDWSFLVPFGGVVGAMIPLATGIVGWIDKRLKENDQRIDSLEILAALQKEAEKDRYELRKIILKLEARIESIRDERVNNRMDEVNIMLRQLLEKRSNE